MKKFLTFILVILLSIPLYYVCRVFIADFYMREGRVMVQNGNYVKSIDMFDRAITLNPLEPFYYENRAKSFAYIYLYSEDLDIKKSMHKSSYEDINRSTKLNANNLRVLRNNLATYYLLTLNHFEDINNITSTYNEEFAPETKEYFNSLKNIYSNDAGVLVDIAHYEKLLGWSDDFIYTKSLIKKLRPDIIEWYPF